MKGGVERFFFYLGGVAVIILMLITFFMRISPYIFSKDICGDCVCDEEGEAGICEDCEYDFNDNLCPESEMEWIGKHYLGVGRCQYTECAVRCRKLFEELREREISGENTTEVWNNITALNCKIICYWIWKKTKDEDLLKGAGCWHYENGEEKVIKG